MWNEHVRSLVDSGEDFSGSHLVAQGVSVAVLHTEICVGRGAGARFDGVLHALQLARELLGA